MDQAKNFAKGTVDGTIESTDTAITVLTGHGDRFPAAPFNAVIWNATDYPDPADDPVKEIVRVTARTGDILTAVDRAQEGTAAVDHNEAGKTYFIIAGLTALAWSTLLGDVFGTGTAILISTDGETIELRQSATKGISIGASTVIEDITEVAIGDNIGNGNGSFISVSDANQRFSLIGMDFATDRTASASGPAGSIVAKLIIKDASGTTVGYIPIHSSIT